MSENNNLPYDPLLIEIADYVDNYEITSATALDTARQCLVDSMACALDALDFKGCKRLLGPLAPGAGMKVGARVPGTEYMLDPVTAAFNISAMVRWTDFNDTWTAPQTTHPSDDVGAIVVMYPATTPLGDASSLAANIKVPVLVLAWGTVSACMSLMRSAAGFYALRLLLGVTVRRALRSALQHTFSPAMHARSGQVL